MAFWTVINQYDPDIKLWKGLHDRHVESRKNPEYAFRDAVPTIPNGSYELESAIREFHEKKSENRPSAGPYEQLLAKRRILSPRERPQSMRGDNNQTSPWRPSRRKRALTISYPDDISTVQNVPYTGHPQHLSPLFSRLPKDLRVRIWREALGGRTIDLTIRDGTLMKTSASQSREAFAPPKAELNVALTCRRAYSETINLLYNVNTFTFGTDQRNSFTQLHRVLLHHRILALRSIQIHWHTDIIEDNYFMEGVSSTDAYAAPLKRSSRGTPRTSPRTSMIKAPDGKVETRWTVLCQRLARMQYLEHISVVLTKASEGVPCRDLLVSYLAPLCAIRPQILDVELHLAEDQTEMLPSDLPFPVKTREYHPQALRRVSGMVKDSELGL